MTRLLASACVNGDSQLTDLLRSFLRVLDRDNDACWCWDEMYTMGSWPVGAHERFVEMGVLKEIEPSALVWLYECEEPNWVEPMWLPDEVHGGRIMGFYCCGREWCGVHVVEHDRRRQWAPSFDGTSRMLQRLLGMDTPWIEDVPGRIRLLGSLPREGQTRDIFLARGLCLSERATPLASARRLASSANATVLCAAQTLPLEQRPAHWRTVLSLDENLTIKDGEVHLPIARLFENQPRPAVTTDEPSLTEEDVMVLETLNENPKRSMLLLELIAATDLHKIVVREAMTRLEQAGFVARPNGTTRKGVAITSAGRAFLSSRA